ncbi:alpha/beta hydrolase [Clostridium tagluense]|uniref:alpha/beta hydrolase n=1 Tax=Clostridium tagluense TaxID=360422 RepID=UPI001C0BBFA9|nr:alpha/beta hydrolase [Clostridium tagluense]MBU3130069.1 lysophospholipase [Clostridium tagluense]MCB2313728.1 alpha/beta hydrolase [Clostridium tagluense]MCB2318508.1 alpha/beta hydrolase [Clostridium tagluense]MCB2323390.1 alpha/beta hydrolase [Clostridium tagluense]MCB2328298.1 alpha/beta hydrolase [Clostridium tagluense]
MKVENFKIKDKGDLEIFVYKWLPDENIQVKGVVQIAHGMAETAARYEGFARALTNDGFIVYANDHRGHGKTAGQISKLGDLGEDGFNSMVENMHQLNERIKEENHNLPIFLFGHSMGSFLTQRYICLYGGGLKGTIVSGSCGKQGIIVDIARLIAKREIRKIGRAGKSNKLDKLSFGNYNNSFKPNRTAFDWLSRDNKQVDKYIDDPFCGTVFTAGFFYDFLGGLKRIADPREIENVPKDLPIYIFSGDKDPVGKNGKGVLKLIKTYKEHGMVDLTYKLYKDGRHEMLNEINREEVIADVIKWLNASLK